MIKILLINPVWGKQRENEVSYALGLGYIIASLKQSSSVTLIDLHNHHKWSDLTNTLVENEYQLVGISLYCGDIDYFSHVTNILNLIMAISPNSILTVGGPYPTFAYKELLEQFVNIHYVILGEGETVFHQIAEKIKSGNMEGITAIKGIAYRQGKEIIANENPGIDLNKIPIPAWDDIIFNRNKIDYIPICIARGCINHCSFCSITLDQNRRIKFRNIASIAEEIKYLTDRFGAKKFYFMNSDFFCYSKYAEQIIQFAADEDAISEYAITTRVDSALKNYSIFEKAISGKCRSIELGIESMSDTQLIRYNKKVTVQENRSCIEKVQRTISNNKNINLNIDFIMFDPYTTVNELEDNINFFFHYKLCSVFYEKCLYTYMKLFHGTEIRKTALNDQLYYDNIFNMNYRFFHKETEGVYAALLSYKNMFQDKLEDISSRLSMIYSMDSYNKFSKIQKMKLYKIFSIRNNITFNFFKECLHSYSKLDLLHIYQNKIEAMKIDIDQILQEGIKYE